ncbi:MAG: gliding motility-associated C-terminal domain-containing protein [Bacteroidales bacterium]|nr:gliding motility-associated C-terminal domain-containing protein [Bacteroidales bacterium]
MMLFISRQAVVNAGPDAIICETGSYSVDGATSQQALSYLWNSSGDGFFSNPAILNPVYIPGPIDIKNGLVALNVTSSSQSFCHDSTDSLFLQINREAIINAGYNDTICNLSVHTITDALASGYDALHWSHDGLGLLTGINTLTPSYTPASGESGMIILTLKAIGLPMCPDRVDQKMLEVIPSVTYTSSENIETCDTTPVAITNITAQHYSSCMWTTNGTGMIDDPTKLNPIYTPGTTDIANGNVTLTFTLTGILPCANQSDHISLTINKNPRVDAGQDTIICEKNTYVASGVSVTDYNSMIWELIPSTAGLLTGINSLTPTFTPLDGFVGNVQLKLTATGNPVCGSKQIFDQISLQIVKAPQVNAGADQTIQESTSVSLTGTANNGSGDYSWLWKPDELLVNPFIYNPVSSDIINDVTFYLRVVDNNTGCTGTDSLNIFTLHTELGLLNIYNFISPNKDDLNDLWIIEGIEEFPENNVIVLNRWGDMIREFTRYNNSTTVWDGTNNKNEPVPDGTYFYILSVKNKGSRTGWIYVQGGHN